MKVGDGMQDGVPSARWSTLKALEPMSTHSYAGIRGQPAPRCARGRAHELGGNFYQPTVLTEVNSEHGGVSATKFSARWRR
jgi:succinate-semialdehyde dehydrogenase/glutarate-semialdehyde dehydrogenase